MMKTHAQAVMAKPKKKSLEARLRSKDRNEFFEALEEAKKDRVFIKAIDTFIKKSTGNQSSPRSF